MDQLQLYINDQLVDLNDDSPIALTFQINNLADVKNQQGNTSNQFKLPLTQRNRQILGFPDDIAFTTNLPYRQYQAKLIQDGLEIIPYGIVELSGIDQDTANITILSGNVDFFDAIDGKLYDMGDSTSIASNYGQNLLWQQYDHAWNVDNIADSQNYTDGWIWPVVDYGAIDQVDFSTPIDVRYQRPGFFIKTAIELLLKSAGYKGTGSLLADPLYPLLICQFSNGSFEHGTDYQNNKDVLGLSAQQQTAATITHYTNNADRNGFYKWDTVLADDSHQLIADRVVFNSKTRNDVTVTVTIPRVHIHGKVGDHPHRTIFTVNIVYRDPNYPATADIALASSDLSFEGYTENKHGENPSGWVRYDNTNGSSLTADLDIYKTTISCNTQLPAGGGIYIGYVLNGDARSWVNIYAGSTLLIQSQQQNVQYSQTVQCERIFPDISQKDLLKDTLQRFGVICQTNNATKTISFNSLRDIVNNIPIAKDWSGKCLNQGKQVAFQLGNYAQINYMQYQDDDNVLPKKYGWSQINIADQTLPASAELFSSPFAATLNRPYYGGTIAQIKTIDDKSDNKDFTISVSPRILIDQKTKLASGKPVTFTDGIKTRTVNDVISTPYFYKPDAPEPEVGYGAASLMFDDLRKKYYPELEKILTQTKKIARYILLTPRDILELDLIIPVYIQQDSAYYYINKIDAWRKGQPTKVELVKLG
ncbi:MAG: hypothetical protein M3O71_26140 [Bacteroidota bacterium]|nr:hypothetical protein [Bacteroidota bacterium]